MFIIVFDVYKLSMQKYKKEKVAHITEKALYIIV